ncbi:hypothetical protein ACFGVR_22545 [Mucilaginibacter sp. AW1-3]
MKRFLPALVLLTALASCNHHNDNKQPATDLRFCGRWLHSKNSPVIYDLKPDGGFTDRTLTFASVDMPLPKPISWRAEGKMLYLQYDYTRYYLKFFKVPVQFTIRDTVKVITDSTMVLATRATGKYPSRIVNLIKMKENGKYTTE